ncbi:hypothetical protein N0V90_007752 [Kalmusia sp. IMI 367209]|nr:hypothetical protein N0V90_007752 [Kalmusia sp. IMI 367209]
MDEENSHSQPEQAATNPMVKSRLLLLPGELRDQIYSFIWDNTEPFDVIYERVKYKPEPYPSVPSAGECRAARPVDFDRSVRLLELVANWLAYNPFTALEHVSMRFAIDNFRFEDITDPVKVDLDSYWYPEAPLAHLLKSVTAELDYRNMIAWPHTGRKGAYDGLAEGMDFLGAFLVGEKGELRLEGDDKFVYERT